MKYDDIVTHLKGISLASNELGVLVNKFYDRNNTAQCDELGKALKSLSAQDLAKVQNGIKVMSDRMSESNKSLNVLYDIVRKHNLPQAMEDQDLELFSVPDIGKITLQSDIYLALPAEHRESFYDWLEENGHGDLIKSKVESGTLKVFVKEYLKRDTEAEDYVPLPEYVKVTPYSFTKITKAKPK